MKEITYNISPTQKKFLRELYEMMNRYYTKGRNSYTTPMGYKLDMRDSMSLLDNILYTETYTPYDKEQLNEIRSMFISLHLM